MLRFQTVGLMIVRLSWPNSTEANSKTAFGKRARIGSTIGVMRSKSSIREELPANPIRSSSLPKDDGCEAEMIDEAERVGKK